LKPILILGAGINGAALARELVLNGLDVVVVDSADIASGTTAYSSRLIHGGLRYLEYADTALVRESLAERARLLKLASEFVRPLEFQIPVERRLGGFLDAAGKLVLGGKYKPRSRRGLWLVRTGLYFYDKFAGSSLPGSRTLEITGRRRELFAPRFTKLCAYYDAQMPYPEQFVAALLDDARRAAVDAGTRFEVHNYSRAALAGAEVVVSDEANGHERSRCEPAAVVNASGPWGDTTLAALGFSGKPLIGGTKGSHIVVFRDDLRAALTTSHDGGATTHDAAVYAEAGDGRPVFILPFTDPARGAAALIGTTDTPYTGDPAEAVATEAEIEYLLALANDVLPGIKLTRGDVALHYAGVRPLPHVDAATPAAISRRHAVVEVPNAPWPAWTLVGGKLTTCRALAEEAAGEVLATLNRAPNHTSRERPIRQVVGDAHDREAVRSVIRSLWVRRLEDLVERRLMLLFARDLSRTALAELADLLVEENVLRASERNEAIESTCRRLREHFGRTIS
jgi:glycerol-3-phosphate dehydrogenase